MLANHSKPSEVVVDGTERSKRRNLNPRFSLGDDQMDITTSIVSTPVASSVPY